MPKYGVQDRKTGRVRYFEWKDTTRQPTYEEAMAEADRNTGATPSRPGQYRGGGLTAPMSSPNHPTNESQSVFSRAWDTAYGGEGSYLPAIRGITRPALPEIKEFSSVVPRKPDGSPDYESELAPDAIAGATIYNKFIQPSSSAIGLISDRLLGKAAGAVGDYVVKPVLGRARSIFSRGAKAADEILPPSVAPPRPALPERATPRGARFYSTEGGPPLDATGPLSPAALKEKLWGADARKVARESRGGAGNAGRVAVVRGPQGRWVSATPEQALPPHLASAELPNVDLPPESVAAYLAGPSRQEAATNLRRTATPWVEDTANMRLLREKGRTVAPPPPPRPQINRTVGGRASDIEYVGRPDVGRGKQITRPTPPPRPASPAPKLKSAGQGSSTAAAEKALKDALKAAPGNKKIQDALRDLKRSREAGFISSELSRHTGSAAVGAAVGGTQGETAGERWRNAAIGGAVGLGASLSFGGGKRPGNAPPSVLHPPSLFSKAGRKRITAEAVDVLNAPRAIMASVDLSAPLRQGITMIHKKEFRKALMPMLKSMASEDSFKALQEGIKQGKNYERMKKARLALTDLNAVDKREELYMSKIAERIPVLGRMIRASGRGYVGFLNKLRADTFDTLVEAAAKAGAKTSDKNIAKFINNATGRGGLGKAERYAPALNAAFFSPRLMASRVQLMNPVNYMQKDKFVRKEYLKSMAAFGTLMTTSLGLAAAAGAEVETDPRSSDFAKIKIGNTRMDIGGGFQQYLRVASQLVSGQRKDLETGQINELAGADPQRWVRGKLTDTEPHYKAKYHDKSVRDVAEEFFEAKAAPIASFMLTMTKGRTFSGEEPQYVPNRENIVDAPSALDEMTKSEITRRLTPMVYQDLWELYREDPDSLWMGVPATFGTSVQVHKQRSARRRRQ